MLYNILTAIALIYEAGLIAYFVMQRFFKYKKNDDAISEKTAWYIVPVFFLVFFIYAMGFTYAGEQWSGPLVIKIFTTSASAFVLNVDLEHIEPLARDNIAYTIAVMIALILAVSTVVVTALALFGERAKNWRRVNAAIKRGKEFVIGSSDNAVSYAKRNDAVLVADLPTEKFMSLINGRVRVIRRTFFGKNKDASNGLDDYLKKRLRAGAMYHFIVFKSDTRDYAELISKFVDEFGRYDSCGFTLHIEASLSEMDVINRKLIDKNRRDNICIKCFSKYELVARKFIIEQPMSRYLPDRFYGEYRTVLPDKNINAVFVGFGKINYELMKHMIIQNQFVGLGKDKFINHPVNYYIYDSDANNLHNDVALRLFGQSKLPEADRVANIKEIAACNAKSHEMIKKIKEIACDPDAFTYILVSIGSDLENIAYAEQLGLLTGSNDNVKMFARTRETTINSESGGLICFGNENEMLSADYIINARLDSLSRDVNDLYDTHAQTAIRKYNSRSTVEFYSNIYNTLSIFFKINLLGLEFVKPDELHGQEQVSKEQLENMFGGNFERKNGYDSYFSLSVWNMLGYSEHSRWVAQYTLDGYSRMPLEDITVQNNDGKISLIAKDHALRRHCCLTDYYKGLDEYHKYLLKLYHDNGDTQKTIDDVETYCYDYMFVDASFDKMSAAGYMLVKRD